MPARVVIVGGNGKVGSRLARLLTSEYEVVSIIRSESQKEAVAATKATPLVVNLETCSVADLTKVFQGAELVYFTAGSGQDNPAERAEGVDFKGPLKVFDAIEGVEGAKPRLIHLTGLDVRADATKFPEHYHEGDQKTSGFIQGMYSHFFKWKYLSDKNLIGRTTFKWTIVRSGGLDDTPGTGKVEVGKGHVSVMISREDVALVLSLLAKRPEAAGLALDVTKGDNEAAFALEAAIKLGESDFKG